MIIPDNIKMFMIIEPIDLRKGIDGYAYYIQDYLHLNPYDKVLYLFTNKNHNKLKILYFDETGFWLLYHRLEDGHFKWRKDKDNKTIIINHDQYDLLMKGLKTDQKLSIKKVIKKYV